MKIKNKVLLITGGTGSFGNAVLDKFLTTDHFKEIRIFSRDEKKQDDMRNFYKNEKIKFHIGDVRDYSSIDRAMKGVDYVFHAAALKQVPTAEIFPLEALKTNALGADNVIKASIKNNIDKVVFLSTDKAVSPVNAMGMTKALMEKIVLSHAMILQQNKSKLQLCITRYGNVLGSRGSLLTVFNNQIKNSNQITITNPSMTRFVMTMDEAIDLVFFAFRYGKNGDLFVRKAPAANVDTFLKSFLMFKNITKYPTKIIGSRYGEKQHESLLNSEEYNLSESKNNYFMLDKTYVSNDKFKDLTKKNKFIPIITIL